MMERLGATWAASQDVLKLRIHLFEPYVNEDLLMDAQELSHYKAPEKQYQACFEIVFVDGLAMWRFAASPEWMGDEQRSHMREQYPSGRPGATDALRRQDDADWPAWCGGGGEIVRIGALNQLGDDCVRRWRD